MRCESRNIKMKGIISMQEFITLAIIAVVVLGFIIYRIVDKKKQLSHPSFIRLVSQSKEFLSILENYKTLYFTNSMKQKLRVEYLDVYNSLRERSKQVTLSKDTSIYNFMRLFQTLDQVVIESNKNYVSQELMFNSDFFNSIDGKTLDNQQRKAVVIDEDSNLIIAGAGSGKTLTIAGKVKYLVEKKNVKGEDILLISFTKKSANEMEERIKLKLNINVKSMTFHRLGLNIISDNLNYRPDIYDNIHEIIGEYFREDILENTDTVAQLLDYFGFYFNIPKQLTEFETLGDAHDHYRHADFATMKFKVIEKENLLKKEKVTIQGEKVRSIEEVIIANYLFLNGINYEYERLYPYNHNDKYRKPYRPDFYLSDYDIYLEHFGITEDYKAPWLSEIEEKKYIESINWKREFHKENKTTLIETYSYFNSGGKFISKLESLLLDHNIEFKEVNYEEIYVHLFKNNDDKDFKEFTKLISTFIGLFKSKGYSIESFETLDANNIKSDNDFLKDRTALFLSIVKPIYMKYQDFLKANNMIDFNDMINLASEFVRNGNSRFTYRYIIIDEYQDTSISRFNLIKEIRNKTNAKILCVGDDWQSIYRFAGSDIDLFTSFEKYFGFSELLKIEKTYRNSQELVNTASSFVMENSNQIRKELTSSKTCIDPIQIITYAYPNHLKQIVAIEVAIERIVASHGDNSEITILGRNNFDIYIYRDDNSEVSDEESKELNEKRKSYSIKELNNQVTITYRKYPKLRINFLTVHRSKGLESDNVIVINLVNRLTGFPNMISDDPILSLVSSNSDYFPFAEERRLFYVALTRTKNSTYLVAPEFEGSTFITELIEKHGVKFRRADEKKSIIDNPNCPRCKKGHLVLRENPANNSKFLGCSNFPYCDNTFKEVSILNDSMTCTSCGGLMVKRNGRNGEFYGCTNYPDCRGTINIVKANNFMIDDVEEN